MNCHEFRIQIVHFQADELPSETRASLQAHLDDCPECARRLEVEDSLLQGVKARLERVPAPPGLETRVRASLKAYGPITGGQAPWFRSPWLAAVAAAGLLTFLILPGIGTGGIVGGADGVVQVAGIEVLVVDRDCDSAGRSILEQRKCRHPKHLNALKVSDSGYWTVSLDQEDGRKILLDPAMRGRRLLVEGDLFPGIHTLRLSHYEVLAETARLGL